MSAKRRWALTMFWIALALALLSLSSVLPTEVVMLSVTALTLGLPVVAWKLYERRSRTATSGERALNFGLMANGIAAGWTMIIFLTIPTGVWGRPMLLPALYLGFGLVTAVAGIGKVVEAWPQERPLAVSALVLCLSIFPVELLTVLAVAFTKAFEFEP